MFYLYRLKDGRDTVYIGITNNLRRREREHDADGKYFTHMYKQRAFRSRSAARAAERAALEGYDRRWGDVPVYNLTPWG